MYIIFWSMFIFKFSRRSFAVIVESALNHVDSLINLLKNSMIQKSKLIMAFY